MSRLPTRLAAVLRTALLIVALAATVAFGADRVATKSAPKAKVAKKFSITGKVVRPLRPGSSEVIEMRLTNRNRFALRVTRLTTVVSVDTKHSRAGCVRRVHYTQSAIPKKSFPLRLPARSTRTLRQLKVKRPPRLTMRALKTNQNACKGAKLRLRFSARATRFKARTR